MTRFALSLGILLLLVSGALGETCEMTIHLRTGETITIPHDAIQRITFTLGQVDVPGAAPCALQLLPGAPNPFNPATTIGYEIPAAGTVALRVFDLHGAVVRELVRESQAAGRHQVAWDGTDDGGLRVASGVYVLRLECGGAALSQRLLLVK